MDSTSQKKSSIADSILAKFQQFNKDKEEAAKQKGKDGFPADQGVKRKYQYDIPHAGLTEKDVGITQYTTENPGFKGIIKHRFNDFQVHEIDLDGNIVELTTTEVIPEPTDVAKVDRNVLPEEYWDRIDDLLSGDEQEALEIDVNDKEKAERSLIHKTIKSIYGSKLYSNTVTVNNKTFIRIGKATNKDRVHWPEYLPPFLHFTVTKKNIDTTHLIYLLAKRLRIKPNMFTYAGNKDRRAITSQRMCVKKRKAQDIAKETLWGVKIGNYEYKNKSLRLGDLSGNRFSITIRNIQAEDRLINEAFENLKTSGFVNYFGLQRFGVSLVAPTFMIGKAIMKRDWKLAVELILKPRPDEKSQPWVKAAREVWWESRECGLALKHLSRHQNSIEYRVLKALKSNPNDFHGALLGIPRNTLLLYLHSYQSYIWNHIVSRRIEKFQLTPQVGDIVLEKSDKIIEEVEYDPMMEKLAEEGKEENGEKDDDAEETPVAETSEDGYKIPVKFLTEEDVKNTSIFDIVYPLPGHNIEYPKNEIADWYKELLNVDDIVLDEFKSNNKLFSLSGTYRKPFDSVKDIDWKIVKHENFDDDLILSDMDKLDNNILPELPEDADHKSVVVNFTLKPSRYATMALREVMKEETSVSFHATLSRNAQETVEKKAKLSDDKGSNEAANGSKET